MYLPTSQHRRAHFAEGTAEHAALRAGDDGQIQPATGTQKSNKNPIYTLYVYKIPPSIVTISPSSIL
jgi:hypothetical protein